MTSSNLISVISPRKWNLKTDILARFLPPSKIINNEINEVSEKSVSSDFSSMIQHDEIMACRRLSRINTFSEMFIRKSELKKLENQSKFKDSMIVIYTIV